MGQYEGCFDMVAIIGNNEAEDARKMMMMGAERASSDQVLVCNSDQLSAMEGRHK